MCARIAHVHERRLASMASMTLASPSKNKGMHVCSVACMCAVHQHNGWAAIGGFGLGHLDVKGMHKLQGCTDGSSVLSIPWLGH